jgi:hypothetical protein
MAWTLNLLYISLSLICGSSLPLFTYCISAFKDMSIHPIRAIAMDVEKAGAGESSTSVSSNFVAGGMPLSHHIRTDVDPTQSRGPIAAYCFMSGFVDAISFSATFVWCGFQTGNFCQLAVAVARLISPGPGGPPDRSFRLADQQALLSLTTFWMGCLFGRFGKRMGWTNRLWLFLGTMVQTVLLAAGAICIWQSGQTSIVSDRNGHPSWTNALTFVGLAFMSASMGLQGVMGRNLETPFSGTLVLTTVWCELLSDPKLYCREWVNTRDSKLITAMSIFLGGLTGKTIADEIGAAGALGIGTGFRILIAFSWMLVPGRQIRPK